MWYESKIFWLNLLTAVAAILALLADPSGDFVTPDVAKWIAFAVAALNVVLRVFFTSQPVMLRRKR
jgi:hypothetical protein